MRPDMLKRRQLTAAGMSMAASLIANRLAVGATAAVADTIGAYTGNDVVFWKFPRVEWFYNRGGAALFEVQTGNGHYIWDPVTDTLTPYDDFPVAKLRKEIVAPSLGIQPLNLEYGMTLTRRPPSMPCQITFNQSLVWEIGGVSQGEFYWIDRNDQPIKRDRGGCDSPVIESRNQLYNGLALIFAFGLSNGMLLLSDAAHGIFVGLRKVPTAILSFDNRDFLVPAQLLKPNLEAAGQSLSRRYAAVLQALKMARPVRLAIPLRTTMQPSNRSE